MKSKRKLNIVAYVIMSIILFSCGTMTTVPTSRSYVEVKVDSYGDESLISEKKCILVCNDMKISEGDLKNLEFEKYIRKTLSAKGYTFTSNKEAANIVIFYQYGISDPRVFERDVIVPVWGQTGISSSRTTTYGNTQRTYNTPSYGVVGSNTVRETDVTYLRYLTISAYDASYYKKTGNDKMIWLVELTSEGRKDDLRYIFPFMLVASEPYIGKSSGRKVEVILRDEPADSRVAALRGY